jgi:hypothetical protein
MPRRSSPRGWRWKNRMKREAKDWKRILKGQGKIENGSDQNLEPPAARRVRAAS